MIIINAFQHVNQKVIINLILYEIQDEYHPVAANSQCIKCSTTYADCATCSATECLVISIFYSNLF